MVAPIATAQIDPVAAEAFERMIKAHRELPAVVVDCTLTISLSEQESSAQGEEISACFTHLRNGDGLIELGGYTINIEGGAIYASHESNPDEYFTLSDVEDVHTALVWECFGSFDRIPFPHLAIFWGVENLDDLYIQFYGDTPEHVPTGLRERVIDGVTVTTIDFTGPEGRMEINLDPETLLVRSIVHTIDGGPPLVPEGVVRTNTFEFDYELPDEFDAASIAFVKGDRQATGMMASLDKTETVGGLAEDLEGGASGLIGQPAPPFLLQTADGEMIDLAKLRGNVVIVDFWATWCPPCRVGLPELHKVAAWANDRGLTVKVLTINIRDETGDTPDAKKEAALAYWAEAGHSIPILLDYEGEAQFAYRVSGIPATFVIDPDGTIAAVHEGIDVNDPGSYSQSLRDEVVRLLEQ
jgi:thiol-disulfide isomerase/thioredoxin